MFLQFFTVWWAQMKYSGVSALSHMLHSYVALTYFDPPQRLLTPLTPARRVVSGRGSKLEQQPILSIFLVFHGLVGPIEVSLCIWSHMVFITVPIVAKRG